MFKNKFTNNRTNNNNNNNRTRINDYIRSPFVILIQDNVNLGVKSIDEARKMARESELDLVEVAPANKPPVCRIMDYSKFKFEQTIKEKDQKKKQKSSQIKELRLSPSIGDHDLQVKLNAAKEFLSENYRVIFRLKYEKRENAHKDLGFVVIKKIIKELEEVATTPSQPKLEGNSLNCIFEPKVKT